MFNETTKEYLRTCIEHSRLGADYTEEAEDEIFDRMESLHLKFDEPGITGNDMCHDLNLVEDYESVCQWKSPTPRTLRDALKAYGEGDLFDALECNRHIRGSGDKMLRQGLILSCYRSLIDEDELYDQLEALCEDAYEALAIFTAFTGGSC
jgi:hypothetical protein